MRSTRQGICLWAALLCTSAFAQSVTPEAEYKDLIKIDQKVTPLGANPFGESVSLYDGSLSFEQTDISAKGAGPLLKLSRTLRVTGDSSYPPGF
jgi:hypothetical protein